MTGNTKEVSKIEDNTEKTNHSIVKDTLYFSLVSRKYIVYSMGESKNYENCSRICSWFRIKSVYYISNIFLFIMCIWEFYEISNKSASWIIHVQFTRFVQHQIISSLVVGLNKRYIITFEFSFNHLIFLQSTILLLNITSRRSDLISLKCWNFLKAVYFRVFSPSLPTWKCILLWNIFKEGMELLSFEYQTQDKKIVLVNLHFSNAPIQNHE